MDLYCSAASLQTLNVMDILINFNVGPTLRDLYHVPGQLLRCGIILLGRTISIRMCVWCDLVGGNIKVASTSSSQGISAGHQNIAL